MAKGGSVTVTPNGVMQFPFSAKVNVATRTGTALVKDMTGAVVLNLVDIDKTF